MRAARVDSNHAQVVQWYRDLGCAVANTKGVGLGVPDLFVGCLGVTDPVEVKATNGQLRPSQENFIKCWRGSPVRIVRTQDDVIEHVADMRRRGRLLVPMIRGLEHDK